MTNQMEVIEISHRVLFVKGHTWEGFRAFHEYELKDGQTVSNMAEAKRIAGDFQSLTSAKVKTIRRVICSQVITQKLK